MAREVLDVLRHKKTDQHFGGIRWFKSCVSNAAGMVQGWGCCNHFCTPS